MRMDFKIEGIEPTMVKLKMLEPEVRKAIDQGMGRACSIIEARAKENISGMHGHTRHVRTGTLRRSIQSRVGWASMYEIVGAIGTDVPYAPYVEALPDGGFLYPALIEVGTKALSYLKDQMALAIKEK